MYLCSELDSVNMFNDIKLCFPKVSQIVIHFRCPSNLDFNNFTFKSLPNLRKITFEQFANNQLHTFNFIKVNKINTIVYNNCLNITELDLIKNHFATNNLRIEITNK